jgi:hypothetical protein
LTGPQILDGKDDEFCDIPSFELNFTNAAKVLEYNTTGGSYPERAVARVAWDDAGLHAFVRVYDTTVTPATSLSTIWNGDGVELLFSSSTSVTGLTSVDTNTLHVLFSPAATPLAATSKDTATSGTETALATSAYAAGSDGTGYWVEFNLPWPGVAPTAGSQIQFDMQLNVADGVTKTSDSYTRDAQAILYQATVTTTSCGLTIAPFCDDRIWCTTTLQN